MQDWLWMSATELGDGIGRGEIDPIALTETYLAAIADHSDQSSIYARSTPERARAEAAAAKTRAGLGQRRSPLDGVPISWKDLFDTGGTATEAGSALLDGRVPARDALVLERATRAGLVCLGKTHMSELAFSGIGINPITATPPNVNDPDAVPGGSSSGAAASVAFGLAASGIGSDTGGSVRIPSAWNNLVGLKTTSGALPNAGVVPLCDFFDTVGPLCRSVADANHLFAIMASRAPQDLRGATLTGTRFLVPDGIAMADLQDQPAAAFQSALDRLKAAGAEVHTKPVPSIDAALGLSGLLFAPEAYATWRDAIEAAPQKMFPEILERFRAGASVSGPDYVAAHQELRALRTAYAQETAGYDAILTPTSPIMPPNRDRMLNDHDYYVAQNLLALRNTRIGNLMGLCGLTLPTGLPACGLQMLCAPMSEPQLLRLGAAAEAALA